jgi:transketolase
MNIRAKIIEASYKANACHIGSALSCAEIIEAIHSVKGIDLFLFSKASGILAYYCYLYGVDKATELIKKYPLPSKEAGCIWTGGSLGQGLSVACGLALAGKKVYCLISDGELQEGQTWEAIMFASHHRLKNLIVVVDRNGLQALGKTESINALEPLEDKFRAFGWNISEVDGHSVKELIRALKQRHKPNVIIANTIKGKGVDFMEGNYEWHYKNLSKEEYEKAIFQVAGK